MVSNLAIQTLQTALRLDSDYVDGYIQLARLLQKADLPREAITAWKEVVSRDSGAKGDMAQANVERLSSQLNSESSGSQ